MPSPGTVTLLSVRTQAKQRADMENSGFVTDPEWNSYISASYKELYDLLISAYGNDYFVAPPVQITTDGTNDKYALPDGTLYSSAPAFYKLLGVDLQTRGNAQELISLKPFTFAERNLFSPYGVQALYANTSLRYRLMGNNLWLTPKPQAGLVLQLWYIPEPGNLVNDTDTFEGVSGWEEYVIIDAAIKALTKEESDISVLGAQKAAMEARLTAMAEDRDAGAPARVADTRSHMGSPYGDPFGGL